MSGHDVRKLSVEAGLLAGLGELRDSLANGERIEKRFTMRTVDLDLEPRDYSSEDIKKLRDTLHASQAVFAQLLGVRVRTLQSWEQGLVPPPIARRLLDLISEDTERWRHVLRGSARGASGH